MERTEDDVFWDLLATWEECYRQGEDISAEELARDHLDLVSKLQDHIRSLKAMDWLLTTEEEETPLNGHPEQLGEYAILERIGGGGMGQVYKALHRRMNRVVALKILPKQALASPHALQRFQQEFQSAAKLAHPNIVGAYDAGECDGMPYLAMEFVEGIDLLRHVQEHGPLLAERAVQIIRQAATGLDYAHGQGVLHRDVKPSNLLLSEDGKVKLLDMGLARFRSLECEETLMGTADFLAPEQTTGNRQANERSEVYSLGCTLYFLLTGKPLFDGRTIIQKVMAHREAPVPSLPAAVPSWLERVFRRMVAKNPENRYRSMAEVVEALGHSPAKHRTWLWAGFAFVLVVVSVCGWMLTSEPPPLNRLNLDFTETDDDALKTIPDLANLGELRLTRTKIKDKGLEALLECKRLEVLDVTSTPITDVGLATLANLSELKYLALSATKITDDGLEHMTRLKKLQHLNLDFTQIGDEGLRRLRDMTTLKELRLTQTRITDAGLPHLGGLTELQFLDLGRTAVTDEGLKHLDGLHDLREVVLAGTKAKFRRTR